MFDTGSNSRRVRRLLRAAMPSTPPPNLSSSLTLRRLSPFLLLAAALVALAVFFAPGGQPAQAQTTTVWSATLTVASDSTTGLIGCTTRQGSLCNSQLTDDDFTYGGVDYTLTTIYVSGAGGLNLRFNKAIPPALKSALTLHVGSSQFPLANASLSAGDSIATWTSTGLSWSAGDTVSLSLTAPSTTAPPPSTPSVKVCWDDDANGDFPESDCGPANRASYGYRILIGSAADGDAGSPAIYVKVTPTLLAGATVRVGTVNLDSNGNITGFVSGNSHSVTSGSQSGPIKLDDGQDYDGDGSISEDERKADRVNTIIGLQYNDSDGVQRTYTLSVQRNVGGL